MASQAVENPSRARRWVEQWKELLDAPVATYHIVLWCVVLLTSFGLIMVLSASSITSYAGGEGNPFSVFLRQAMFAVVGMGLMFVVARFKVKTWKKLAPVLLIGGLLLQVPVSYTHLTLPTSDLV